jgi:spore maturation protein A
MLNYVWIALIAIGILVAVGTDFHEQGVNKYRNGIEMDAVVKFDQPFLSEQPKPQNGVLVVPSADFNSFYGLTGAPSDSIFQPALVTLSSNKEGSIVLSISERTPSFWQEMAKSGGTKDKLFGKIKILAPIAENSTKIRLTLNPVTFVRMRSVTQSALEYAERAVTIALGLIGIMALWLGIMKVADEAGLIKFIARLLRPVTRLLFPEIPQDHPALGSMIMNISANLLGLSNAATPFGLKAMEELDTINPKKGTATNAMCTFLAINTGGLVLIPATAIAIRASMGSTDPAIIIGTSIFGASCATVVGVISAKLLQRLPVFKNQLIVGQGAKLSVGESGKDQDTNSHPQE